MRPAIPILYEDGDIIVINKPAGVLVHPVKSETGTLVDLFKEKLAPTDPVRPGIVHRLDRDTSGVMVLAKTRPAYELLVTAFRERKVTKRYKALVHGRLEGTGEIRLPIGRNAKTRDSMAVAAAGKPSVTRYKAAAHFGERYTLLDLDLLTGRTHQIRAHLAAIGHPVVGDALYGRKNDPLDRQFLHAAELTIPLRSGETQTFSAELPEELAAFMNSLAPL